MTNLETKAPRRGPPGIDDSPIIGRRAGQASRFNRRRYGFITICALGALLGGCKPGAAASDDPVSAEPASSAESGYVSPPEAVSGQRAPGGVVLSGRSDPDARVRLSSPEGDAFGGTASAQGAWSITAPIGASVRLFGLSEVLGSRVVQGAGYLAVLPAPGRPVVFLRAGGDSEALSEPRAAPRITTIDYDAGGGAVISGMAKAGVTVRLTLDGGPVGEARADGRGRFSIPLAGALRPGDHDVAVQANTGLDHAAFSYDPPPAITGLPYRGQRQAAAWRIDWLTPAGSPQTTLVLDPAAEPGRP